MLITKIRGRSSADKKGLKIYDNIKEINGNVVKDALDFYLNKTMIPLEMIIEREGETFSVYFETYKEVSHLGIEVEEMKIKNCGNRCVFCFVDQNPKGLRKSLYIKDEDYRYSFLYGSFFTLSNINKREIDRIINENLSPLYISVHATNPEIRLKLLGIKKDDKLLGKIKLLTDNGIQLHTQIVLCPEINDGDILTDTVNTLNSFYPNILSTAIVPLGKTMHRNQLVNLRSINTADAQEVINLTEQLQSKFLKNNGTRFVFAADEFYLLADKKIPTDKEYEEYQQYENGVGLVRYFMKNFTNAKKTYPSSLLKPISVLIVTGKSFFPIVRKHILPVLNKIKNMTADVIYAENHLLGNEITVAGLLCGKDIISAVEQSGVRADIIIIPESSLNNNKIMLDDMNLRQLKNKLKAKILTSDVLINKNKFFTDF